MLFFHSMLKKHEHKIGSVFKDLYQDHIINQKWWFL